MSDRSQYCKEIQDALEISDILKTSKISKNSLVYRLKKSLQTIENRLVLLRLPEDIKLLLGGEGNEKLKPTIGCIIARVRVAPSTAFLKEHLEKHYTSEKISDVDVDGLSDLERMHWFWRVLCRNILNNRLKIDGARNYIGMMSAKARRYEGTVWLTQCGKIEKTEGKETVRSTLAFEVVRNDVDSNTRHVVPVNNNIVHQTRPTNALVRAESECHTSTRKLCGLGRSELPRFPKYFKVLDLRSQKIIESKVRSLSHYRELYQRGLFDWQIERKPRPSECPDLALVEEIMYCY